MRLFLASRRSRIPSLLARVLPRGDMTTRRGSACWTRPSWRGSCNAPVSRSWMHSPTPRKAEDSQGREEHDDPGHSREHDHQTLRSSRTRAALGGARSDEHGEQPDPYRDDGHGDPTAYPREGRPVLLARLPLAIGAQGERSGDDADTEPDEIEAPYDPSGRQR